MLTGVGGTIRVPPARPARPPWPQPEVRYGTLDGRPVLFTLTWAVWFVDGAWQPLHPAEANWQATLLAPADFAERWPDLPAVVRPS